MKYLDLFSGYGGFSLGIKNSVEDSECIGFSEIDKYAIQIYKRHFPEHQELGDITKLDPATLPDFDLLTGGFPCQAFSIAGKRGGFEDTRGTLIFDVFRILKEKQPRLCLLENVKGLLSHDNGRTFKTIITSLAELGYAVEWQVLNAKNFGVPQNRERVFVVGHLGGFGGRKVFPIGESNANDIVQLNEPTHSNDRVYGTQGIAPTLNTMQGWRRQPKIAPTLRANHHNTADVHFIKQKPAEADFAEVPIQAQSRNNGTSIPDILERNKDKLGRNRPVFYARHLDEKTAIRRLTPTECERLMGLPDGWTEGVSDTQRYKLCGNGVVVPVVQSIVKNISENYSF